MKLHLLKVHLQKFPSTPVTQKCQILSCDTLVTNERRFRNLLSYVRDEHTLGIFKSHNKEEEELKKTAE